ncbi:MAG TPA: serine/threonine-protein kinase [Polyangiaceae bacterium]|nr:serine/threonine-protein kinase [Polyangiaceae bacterium]
MTGRRLVKGEIYAGAYEIVELIGSGSMGVVYRAIARASGRTIALKLMHAALAHDAKSVHRFQREARAGMTIRDPHIAGVLGASENPETEERWLVMEYADGRDLGVFMREHSPLAAGVEAELLRQLYSAVRAAHKASVVHRDLKPENIMVDGAPGGPLLLKVLDFGIAKTLLSATAISTSPGQGTPLWTAPEQTRMDDVPKPTSDVWALGLLTFFVLTGKIYWSNAHGRSSMVKLAMELARDPIVAPSQRARELGMDVRLPGSFDDWFLHCVNRDPKSRFVDANAAYHALTACLSRR